MGETRYSLADLLRVMRRLRDPETGCPWDLAQDFSSIVPSTLEECYELAHAIEHADYGQVADELGDVLFQVVFYAQLGEEKNLFGFDSIIDTLVDKLIRRHPHIFAGGEIDGVAAARYSVEAVKTTWEAIKETERRARHQSGVLDDVPLALPALPRAQKIQKRAARVKFDWTNAAQVMAKLQEEVVELQLAVDAGEEAGVREELGDVLFTCVNLARHLGVNAEASLRHSTDKFERRFRWMEAAIARQGRALTDASEAQLDLLWTQAKHALDGGEQDL